MTDRQGAFFLGTALHAADRHKHPILIEECLGKTNAIQHSSVRVWAYVDYGAQDSAVVREYVYSAVA